ncbi:hypothetical protein CYMTET_11087 [Cymbomonas tetramitiformis]|uniref:EF-hand domain-containing protein n=1 Tax=Cymbomonas tetramitiformis TaxID=36881 RepID=A0AAE0LDT8_9CHLO|nr:hypothetical protein CYMTET_11087 [Cymbomonas tetramitiformis]
MATAGTPSRYSRKSIENLHKIFTAVDTDKNGTVSNHEFENYTATGTELGAFNREMFATMDVNRSGEIDFKDMLRVCYPSVTSKDLDVMLSFVASKGSKEPILRRKSSAEAYKACFVIYDEDGDGLIEPHQFFEACERVGFPEDQARTEMRNLGLEDHQPINLETFTKVMKRWLD